MNTAEGSNWKATSSITPAFNTLPSLSCQEISNFYENQKHGMSLAQ
jgi:hypothetical protein